MSQKVENPPGERRASELVLLGGADKQKFTPPKSENQEIWSYLVGRYGIPPVRVRTIAELAGIGGCHE